MFFHNINPVLFAFGPLEIKYYGLAYALGMLIGIELIKRVYNHNFKITPKELDTLLVYIIFGVIIGGRMGYICFYQPEKFLSLELFYIWKGGMSFHGGLGGVIAAIYLFAKKFKYNFLNITDHLSMVTPIGLFLGRIANFINGELFGRVTDRSWGVVFQYGGNIPRHPSQLYEAFFEGVVLFAVLNLLYFKTNISQYAGRLSGVFLLGYGVFRLLVENFREPDFQLGLLFGSLTMGQILSIPMILFGIILIKRATKFV
ncbi:prolipoprotein diacylglyceryl transferase [Rickettsiales endosymbiont of Stachyamoeba lipophora]|uniref:prolipoprotein diacylglyceryl transferase n=1 Tax=Rickettsiales endosymbiont of Stachyamoeba lipophora TaxID=2486578 RepID=UPI000F64FECE|nr:prolipoprotein diacylglyceryl transferase [Rickettsiales endosymbiont of Stachyamoeba lipophora]AZL16464.1 prolipoprotein diacylglyceryl transferase [Rickettsiales endosymbiont of Stachyamoeba lipophora]